MTVIFKNCGTVDIDGLQRMLQPIIDQMEADPSFTQFGFKGRQLPDGTIDYGEGRGLDFIKTFTTYTHWQPGYEDQKILEFTGVVDAIRISRIRLMKIMPFCCYSWHQDATARLHIPIITNPNSFLVVENQAKHLARGFLWYVNTKKPHSAFNGGDKNRYHVVYEYVGTPDMLPTWSG